MNKVMNIKNSWRMRENSRSVERNPVGPCDFSVTLQAFYHLKFFSNLTDNHFSLLTNLYSHFLTIVSFGFVNLSQTSSCYWIFFKILEKLLG